MSAIALGATSKAAARNSLALLAVTLVALAACSSNSKQSLCEAGSGSGAFTVGGVLYADACTASTWGAVSSGSELEVIIDDQHNAFDISLVIPYPPAVGTYSLNQDGTGNAPSFATVEASADGGTVSGTWRTGGANTGTVVITSFDANSNRLSGTFSFDGGPISPPSLTTALQVTAGTFTVTAATPIP